MAWYVSTSANKVYACETCTDANKLERNCEGRFYNDEGKHKFNFQIGDPQLGTAETQDDCFIHECPTLYIRNYTRLLWGKYQDLKFKCDIGLPVGDIPAYQFKSFKIFAQACQEHDDWKAKKDKKGKKNRSSEGLRGLKSKSASSKRLKG